MGLKPKPTKDNYKITVVFGREAITKKEYSTTYTTHYPKSWAKTEIREHVVDWLYHKYYGWIYFYIDKI